MITLKRILVPTDFSKFADSALAYACGIGKRFDCELTLLNVVHSALLMYADEPALIPENYSEELRKSAERQLAKLPEESDADQLNVIRSVREGTPFLEIIRYASSNSIDLIVMGTHGRTGMAHLLIGSVAEKVVRKAPCPVLTVRDPEHKFVMP